MIETQPFEFRIDPHDVTKCGICFVYQSEVYAAGALHLCRTCLRRMRATLKAAEKALPPLPKRVRPDDE